MKELSHAKIIDLWIEASSLAEKNNLTIKTCAKGNVIKLYGAGGLFINQEGDIRIVVLSLRGLKK